MSVFASFVRLSLLKYDIRYRDRRYFVWFLLSAKVGGKAKEKKKDL